MEFRFGQYEMFTRAAGSPPLLQSVALTFNFAVLSSLRQRKVV